MRQGENRFIFTQLHQQQHYRKEQKSHNLNASLECIAKQKHQQKHKQQQQYRHKLQQHFNREKTNENGFLKI